MVHGLRMYFASAASAAGSPLTWIKQQGGWKSDAGAFGYIRPIVGADAWTTDALDVLPRQVTSGGNHVR